MLPSLRIIATWLFEKFIIDSIMCLAKNGKRNATIGLVGFVGDGDRDIPVAGNNILVPWELWHASSWNKYGSKEEKEMSDRICNLSLDALILVGKEIIGILKKAHYSVSAHYPSRSELSVDFFKKSWFIDVSW